MSRGDASRRGLDLAEEAYDLVQVRPARAAALAERALAVARSEADPEAQVAALHALSWAQRVIGDPRAIRTARAGIRIGEKHGARRRVALLRRNFSHTLGFAGHTEAAGREINAAIAALRGVDRAQSEVFRIAVHRGAHTVDPSTHRAVLASAARALRLFERRGDLIWQARLLHNRGALHADRGELGAAEADFRRARDLYRRVGAEDAATDSAVGLAEVALLRGDVVACLAAIDDLDSDSFSLEYCRAVALAQARLLAEANVAIAAYIDACARSGRRDFVPTALLDAATIALRSGDATAALHHARRAARSFAARRKPLDAARARAACLRAQLSAGSLRRSSIRAGLDTAAVLETAGWRREALRTHLLVARVALALGSARTAQRQLELARPLRSLGTVADRIELAHTRALLQAADGNSLAAERSLLNGLELLDDYQAALGAVELRATAAAMGTDLSETGLRLAFASGKPAKVLDWAERLRGNALRLPIVRPAHDPKLRASQVALRNVEAQIREAELNGRPVGRLTARQSELETAIRARTRHARGSAQQRTASRPADAAARALGDRVLVEYVELDGMLRALTLMRGRVALHELGAVTAGEQLEWLRFALRRLAGRSSREQRAVALRNAHTAAAALDRLLVEPLLPTIGDAPLVVVPTGALHALPWGALPSLRGRPLVVAPSFSVWLDIAERPSSRRRKTTFIAGPGLRHAAAEVRDLAALVPAPTVLLGKAATAAAALAALDGAAFAHVACHGRFRSDSPLFSSLELADGPLTALDLQRLRRAPDVLVLSSCDLALSDRHPGDELLGLAAALLAMGTRTIVASVVSIPDAAARRLMVAFQRELGTGGSPASALARAQAALQSNAAALAGFVCLGNG